MARHHRQQQQGQLRQFQAGHGSLGGALLLCLVFLMLACGAAARPLPSEYRYRGRLYVMERDREFYRQQEDSVPDDDLVVLERGGNGEDFSRESCYGLTNRSCEVMDHRMLEDYAPPSLANNPHPGGPLP